MKYNILSKISIVFFALIIISEVNANCPKSEDVQNGLLNSPEEPNDLLNNPDGYLFKNIELFGFDVIHRIKGRGPRLTANKKLKVRKMTFEEASIESSVHGKEVCRYVGSEPNKANVRIFLFK